MLLGNNYLPQSSFFCPNTDITLSDGAIENWEHKTDFVYSNNYVGKFEYLSEFIDGYKRHEDQLGKKFFNMYAYSRIGYAFAMTATTHRSRYGGIDRYEDDTESPFSGARWDMDPPELVIAGDDVSLQYPDRGTPQTYAIESRTSSVNGKLSYTTPTHLNCTAPISTSCSTTDPPRATTSSVGSFPSFQPFKTRR